MRKPNSRLTPDRLTAGQVGEKCGVTRQTAQAWYNEGLTRSPTLEQLIHFLANRQGYAPGSERERLARAQAEKFELENSRRRKELVLVAYVESIFHGMAADINARLDAIGGRLANEFPGNDPGAVRARIRAETDAVRSGIAEYFRKLDESPPPDADGEVETAPASDGKRVGRRKPRTSTRKQRARKVPKRKNAVHKGDSSGS